MKSRPINMTMYMNVRDDKGLSLVELMVVLVLSLMLMAAVYMTYQIQHRTSEAQHRVTAVQQDLRAVLNIMSRDIRQAGCDPTMHSTAGIIPNESGPSALSFSMDLNEDGDTGDANPEEQVAFTLSGTDIQRNGVTLAQNVTTLGFVYYDENNTVITPTDAGGSSLTATEASDVRDVEIRVRVQSDKRDPETNQFISRAMTKRLKLRNQGI